MSAQCQKHADRGGSALTGQAVDSDVRGLEVTRTIVDGPCRTCQSEVIGGTSAERTVWVIANADFAISEEAAPGDLVEDGAVCDLLQTHCRVLVVGNLHGLGRVDGRHRERCDG